MDFMMLTIGVGLILTGAVFFGYPLGYALGKRSAHDEICNLPARDSEPTPVRAARERLRCREITVLTREEVFQRLAERMEEK